MNTNLQLLDKSTGEVVNLVSVKSMLKQIKEMPEADQSAILTKANELRKVLEKIEKQIKGVATEKAVLDEDTNEGEWFGHLVKEVFQVRFDEAAMLANEDPDFCAQYLEAKKKYGKTSSYKKVI